MQQVPCVVNKKQGTWLHTAASASAVLPAGHAIAWQNTGSRRHGGNEVFVAAVLVCGPTENREQAAPKETQKTQMQEANSADCVIGTSLRSHGTRHNAQKASVATTTSTRMSRVSRGSIQLKVSCQGFCQWARLHTACPGAMPKRDANKAATAGKV